MPFKRTKHGQLLKTIAQEFSCSVETARNWEKEGAPIHDAEELREWLDGRKSGNDELEPADLKSAKLAKIKAETERIKFRLKVDRGDYTENAEVVRMFTLLGSETRSELMLLLSEAPTWAGLSAAELQDKARAFVHAALDRLSTHGKRK